MSKGKFKRVVNDKNKYIIDALILDHFSNTKSIRKTSVLTGASYSYIRNLLITKGLVVPTVALKEPAKVTKKSWIEKILGWFI